MDKRLIADGAWVDDTEGNTWRVMHQHDRNKRYEAKFEMSEVRAVYSCAKVKGPSHHNEVILKIHMQDGYNPTRTPMSVARNEVRILEHLTEKDSAVTPHLLSVIYDTQMETDMPLQGGYFLKIFMTKVPGRDLRDLWKSPPEGKQKLELSQAFEKALRQLFLLRVDTFGAKPANVLYDEGGKKCYFVDCEHMLIEKNQPEFTKFHYEEWKLEELDPNPEETISVTWGC